MLKESLCDSGASQASTDNGNLDRGRGVGHIDSVADDIGIGKIKVGRNSIVDAAIQIEWKWRWPALLIPPGLYIVVDNQPDYLLRRANPTIYTFSRLIGYFPREGHN